MSEYGTDGTAAEGELFRLLAENVKDYAIFVLDHQGRVQTWSEGAERLLCYSENEILGEQVDKFYTSEDIRDGVPKGELKQALFTGRGEDDRWHVRKDGSRFWSSGVMTPLRDEAGNVRGFAKIVRDRTDLKRSETSLRDALEYAQNIVQTVREPLLVLDSELRVRTANRAFYHTFESSAEEVEGQSLFELGGARWANPQLRMLLEEILPGQSSFDDFEVEQDFPGLGRRSMLLSARRIWREGNHSELILLAIADVTGQKRAEERQRVSEGKLLYTLDAIEIGQWELDLTTDTSSRTPLHDLIFGYESPPPNWSYDFFLNRHVHPDDRDRVDSAFQVALGSGTDWEFECRIIRADEAMRWIWAKGSVSERDACGQPLRMLGLVRDITDRRKSEAARRQQSRLSRTITDNATTAIFTMDAEGRVTFMNPAAEEMTGHRFEEAHGEILHDLIHHARPDGRRLLMEDCTIGRTIFGHRQLRNHEDVFVRKNGTLFPVRCSSTPMHEGEILTGIVLEVVDITETKRAEQAQRESDERFRAISEHSITGIAEVDLTGRMLFVNDRYCEVLERSREELLGGMRMQDVTHPDDLPRNLPLFERLVRDGKPFVIEKRYVRPDGTSVWVNNSVSGVRGPDGRVKSVVAVSVDVNDRKRAEDELREANRRKDEFLAMLAHELRNPLAPIRTGLDLLSLSGADEQVVEPMQQQVTHLVRLVDDLLDVSRIMRGRVELRKEAVELASVVKRAVETIGPRIEERRQNLSISLPSDPVWLHADPVRLAQVVANLLHNASKYNEDGGEILLAAEVTSGEVIVRVQDTGIGIERELLPQVFDLFTQATTTIDRSQGGLGIGLTLVKRLVEMHDGSVSVRSEGQGQGSEFTIRLPILPGAIEGEPIRGAVSATTNYRILVVDDNAPAAKLLARLLEKLGNHEVILAHDGATALEAAREHRPQIILLDIGLPKMDGYEVVRRLRQQPEFEETLVIALTGYGTGEDRRKSLHAGCDDHFVKPPSLDDLRNVLTHPKLPTS